MDGLLILGILLIMVKNTFVTK